MTKRKKPKPVTTFGPGDNPRDQIAVDSTGRVLPYAPDEVQAQINRMIENGGEIMAVIIRAANGDLAVPVFGPPSRALLDVLELTVDAYRNVLKGQG